MFEMWNSLPLSMGKEHGTGRIQKVSKSYPNRSSILVKGSIAFVSILLPGSCCNHRGVNLKLWMITSTSWLFFGANPLKSHRLMCTGIGCCEMCNEASLGA